MDTIAAICTPLVPEQGSVAIVRISGPQAQAVAQALFVAPRVPSWESHRIYYGHIHDRGRMVDEVLLLWMQAPRSYTREDVIEIHCHGGVVVVQEVLALCLAQGARLAQPGEFTLRAFLNGRLDLSQAESVAQMVSSRSPQAAHVALAGLTGKLARPIRRLRAQCLGLLGDIEARLDFEEDLPPLDLLEFERVLSEVETEVGQLLATASQGELLRTGLRIAIVGRPNVGKSSLLNGWSQRERAIVTAHAGTTRDVVDVELIVRGMPVVVLDTAGIRQTSEAVEEMGIRRSRQAMAQADLVLLVIDAVDPWTPADQEIFQEIHQPCIIVANKIDLAPVPDLDLPAPVVAFSALMGRGIPDLETALWQKVSDGLTGAGLDVAINQRQKAALSCVHQSLLKLRETQGLDLPLDFWSIDLRDMIEALGLITGETVTESVLDNIFSRFCMGK